MHPLLRTLDWTADLGMASSALDLHPIWQAAPARSRGLPLVLSLGLTPLLILGLSVIITAPPSLRTDRRAGEQASRSVVLMLQELDPIPGAQAPVRNLLGPEGPGGAGHREGTSTLDPRLAAFPTPPLSIPSEAVDPEALSLSPRAERVEVSVNPALPPHTGGNGMTRGTGQDPALGQGGLIRHPGAAATPDLRLVPTRQVVVNHRLAQGEAAAAQQPLRVRILIGDDGVPLQATVLSGALFLHEEALKAALQWRFEPLKDHGLKAPVALILTFRPNFLGSR